MTPKEREHLNWQTIAIDYIVDKLSSRTVNPTIPPPKPDPADD